MSVVSSSIAPRSNVPKLNGSHYTQLDQSGSIEKLSVLVFSGKTLLFESFLLSGSARLTKLNEAQSILIRAFNIEPNNASILHSLGKIAMLEVYFFPRYELLKKN